MDQPIQIDQQQLHPVPHYHRSDITANRPLIAVRYHIAQAKLHQPGDAITIANVVNDNTDSFDSDSFRVLKGLEAVRMRPGMHIGGTGLDGVHHLIKEIVDNSVDEAVAGYCEAIDVTLTPEGNVTVSDNGRGIPVVPHPDTGITGLETVLTTLHAGRKFEAGASNRVLKMAGLLAVIGLAIDW